MIVFEELFEKNKFQPFIYKNNLIQRIDRIAISNELIVKISFLEINSDWRQGFIFETEGSFKVEKKEIRDSIVFWHDTAPSSFEVQINSINNELIVYNVWDVGNGIVHTFHNGQAFFKKNENNKTIFYCNDGFPDDDFDDLIFSIDWN
jgi:hypothetical protein